MPNQQRLIDKILETENLTDGLEDDDADWLLHWGVGKVGTVIANARNDQDAGERVDRLMVVMRKLNQITADREVKSSSDHANDSQDFPSTYATAFGSAKNLTSTQLQSASTHFKSGTPLKTIQSLIA